MAKGLISVINNWATYFDGVPFFSYFLPRRTVEKEKNEHHLSHPRHQDFTVHIYTFNLKLDEY